jgi:hypothetical protein
MSVNFKIKLFYVIAWIFLSSIYLSAKTDNFCSWKAEQSINSRYITFDSSNKKPIFKDNTLNWYYNSIDYKGFSDFDKEKIITIIKKAMSSWSQYADIKFVYKGESPKYITNTNDETITIGFLNKNDFNDVCKKESFGCASSLWNSSKIIYDGFIALNPEHYHRISKLGLQGLITHEVGHLLGIGHSDNKNSIMYAKPYHLASYQAKLRKDDIKAISSLYPLSTKWQTGAYKDNENKSKILSINNAKSLKVEVIGNTEKNYDYISFFDIQENKIKSFSGLINKKFTIQGSYIKAVLTSDESVVDFGVDVSISSF